MPRPRERHPPQSTASLRGESGGSASRGASGAAGPGLRPSREPACRGRGNAGRRGPGPPPYAEVEEAALSAAPYSAARVQATSFRPFRVKVTWKSCRDPASNEACAPAR